MENCLIFVFFPKDCQKVNGRCLINGHAFYYLSIGCLASGVVWWLCYRPIVRELSGYAETVWNGQAVDSLNEVNQIFRV